MSNRKKVALVSYASPSLIPANLKKVAAILGGNRDGLKTVEVEWVASPSVAPASKVCWGAVQYATQSLAPAGMLPVALEEYLARVVSLGPIGYWPMDEATGTVAFDRSGNARNGAYTGVTLGQTGIGDGRTAPSFDGTTSFCNIYGASLAGAFNGAEGTALCWVKVSAAGIWGDGVATRPLSLRADANNLVRFEESALNNRFDLVYIAGATTKQIQVEPISPTGWSSFAITWSKSSGASGEVKGYYNGTQFGSTLDTLGVWAGALAATVTTIGAGSTTPANPWSGLAAHVAVWARALTAAEIASIGSPL